MRGFFEGMKDFRRCSYVLEDLLFWASEPFAGQPRPVTGSFSVINYSRPVHVIRERDGWHTYVDTPPRFVDAALRGER